MDPAAATASAPRPLGGAAVVVDEPAPPAARAATPAPPSWWTAATAASWAAAGPPARAATTPPRARRAAAPRAQAAAPPPRPAAAAPPPARGAAAPAPPPAQGAAAPAPAPAPAAAAPTPAQAPGAQQARVEAAVKACTRLVKRTALVAFLFVLGLAAAAFAMYTMILDPADYSSRGPCTPTDEEAAGLRASSKLLLLSASALALASAVSLLAPTWSLPVYAASIMGIATENDAFSVIWALVACHDHVEGALAVRYWSLVAVAVLVFVVHFEYVAGLLDDDKSDD